MSLTDNTALKYDFVMDKETEFEPAIPRTGKVSGEETAAMSPLVAPQTRSERTQGATSDNQISVEPSSVKLISRNIAELTPDEEYKQLLEQKRVFLRKKYVEGLSKKEELTLQLTIWNIDRIEDAKYGKNLDALEAVVKAQETAAARISRTLNDFDRIIASQQSPRVRSHR